MAPPKYFAREIFLIQNADHIICCLQDFRAAVPIIFGARDQFYGRQFFHGGGMGGDGSGGNASNGEQWGAADEASLT